MASDALIANDACAMRRRDTGTFTTRTDCRYNTTTFGKEKGPAFITMKAEQLGQYPEVCVGQRRGDGTSGIAGSFCRGSSDGYKERTMGEPA